ncbi:MAG: hypothetical protein Q6363_009815 [Candidatus Njordarchaeota archaeon]
MREAIIVNMKKIIEPAKPLWDFIVKHDEHVSPFDFDIVLWIDVQKDDHHSIILLEDGDEKIFERATTPELYEILSNPDNPLYKYFISSSIPKVMTAHASGGCGIEIKQLKIKKQSTYLYIYEIEL